MEDLDELKRRIKSQRITIIILTIYALLTLIVQLYNMLA